MFPLLYTIRKALEITDENKELTIKTDSKYAINGLTKFNKKWEKLGWIGIQNKALLKETLDTLRARKTKTTFEWVKGHSGEHRNEEADKLAKLGADKEEIQEPQNFLQITTLLGAQLSAITQTLIYKELLNRKLNPIEKRCDEMITQIKTDIRERQETALTNEAIWTNLLKSKIVYQTHQEFLYKTIKGAQKIGEWWSNTPNYKLRAICSICGVTENIKYILTECQAPGQHKIWQGIKQIWRKKYYHWEKPLIGEILRYASVKFHNDKGKVDTGKS